MQTPCPSCGALNRPTANFCAICRTALQSAPQRAPGLAPPTTLMPAATAPRLVANTGAVYSLSSPSQTIGREACDITLATDTRLSRQHARFEQMSAGWQITDLGSSNGTFVNGQRLMVGQAWRLQVNDQIVVGGALLTFDPSPGQALTPGRSTNATQLYDPATGFQPLMAANQSNIPWQTWSTPPQVEGHVEYIDAAPRMEQKPIWGKAAVAGAIAVVAPRFMFLPFLGRNEVPVINMRVIDRNSGQIVAIRIRGDLQGGINLGDDVAVWAKSLRGGGLEMTRAYNYTTQTELVVKG